MARAQKPDFVFRRNGRVNLSRWVRQFSRLLAAEVCASAVVMLDTPCSVVVWRVLTTHSIRQFPLHVPSRASPCAITFQVDSTTLFMSTLNREVGCFSETSVSPTILHGVITHKPTLRILNMANTPNAFCTSARTGGSQVTSMKSGDGRRALEDNRTNLEWRTNGRTDREIRNISRHDVRTAVRHFAPETALCYCIPFVQDIRLDNRPIKHYILAFVVKQHICRRLYFLPWYCEL
jgi:hypothetical protein